MQAIPLSILLLVMSNIFMTLPQLRIVPEVITLAGYFIFRDGPGA